MKKLNNSFLTQINQARLCRKNGLVDQAIEYYKSSLSIKNEAWDIHYELAIYYCLNSKPHNAIDHFKILITKFPQNADVYRDFAIALSESENYQDAIKYFRNTLQLNPNQINLYVPLGETFRRIGRYEEAIDAFKHVLSLNPGNHGAIFSMGLTYRDMENYPEALECFEKASDLEPNQPFYKLQFGNLLYKVGFINLAQLQIESALKLQPNWFDAQALYIDILQAVYKYKEALDILANMAKEQPDNLDLAIKRAEIYVDINMHEEALEIYDALVAKQPDFTKAVIGKFNILLQQGSIHQARELVEKYITENPENQDFYILHLYVAKYSVSDPIVKRLISTIDAMQQSNASASAALAKVMEDNCEWDEAIKYYQKAKHEWHKNNLEKYNPEQLEAYVGAIIDTFDKNLVEYLGGYSVKSNLPIIVLGMPRSGKTLIAELLSCHKEVQNQDEINYWANTSDVKGELGTFKFPESTIYINDNTAKRMVSGYLDILGSFLKNSNITKVVDTFPYNFQQLGLIASLLPEALLLHSKRDARDTCLQIYFKNFEHGHEYTRTLEHIFHFHQQYERLMLHWKQLFPNKIIDVDFEEMVLEPQILFGRLIKLLNLPENEETVDWEKLRKLETRIKGYSTSIGLWKNYQKHLDPLKRTFNVI